MQLLSRNTASNVQRAEYIRKMFSGKIGMGVQMFDPFITLAQHTFVNENKKKAKFS